MTLGGLGSRDRRGAGLPLLPLFSGLLLILGVVQFGRELVTYSIEKDSLRADVRIAGIQVGGLSESEAQLKWEEVYLDQPIVLSYHGSPILLDPRSVGFRTNNESMLAKARAQRDAQGDFWTGFWAYLTNQEPSAVNVPLEATLQESLLRAALEDISARYDAIPSGSNFDLTTLTFRGGPGGTRLDVDRALAMIGDALYDPNPDVRVIDLPTTTIAGAEPGIEDLRQAVLDYAQVEGFLFDGATTIGSLFVMDLNSGEEMSILADVTHSAVSTIKVGVLINYFRYQLVNPDPDSAFLIAAAAICSANHAANFLMQITGSDSRGQEVIQGLYNTTETMIEIGAARSAILSPLYVGDDGSYPVIALPEGAEQKNPNYDANADPLNHTTAEDMGTMLQLVYDCAFNGGGLRAIFPEDITQTECQQILEVLSGVRFSRFTELGAPAGTRISHKVGYGAETVGDVALVYSPATDYIFVMYIWEQDLNYNGITELDKWALIDNISRIVYNYFNRSDPLLQTRPPDNPWGGAACVLPQTASINLNNINENRFDANGNPLPGACYDWPQCRPFDNWGRDS